MDPLMLVLRFLHIVGGALWVGSVFLFTVYVGPAAAEVAPTSGPLMSTLIKKRRVGRVLGGLAAITVIAGWLMWLISVQRVGSVGEYVGTTYGLVLTIGGILATVAGVVGIFGVARNVERVVDVGDAVRGAGGPPSDEQRADLARLGGLVKRNGLITIVLLILAVGAMATARYW